MPLAWERRSGMLFAKAMRSYQLVYLYEAALTRRCTVVQDRAELTTEAL